VLPWGWTVPMSQKHAEWRRCPLQQCRRCKRQANQVKERRNEQTNCFLRRRYLDSVQNDTNVYKLFKAILIASDQVAFYDDGVGSDGTPLEKLTGGAFGDGLFQKIKDGYTKIAHVYDGGDEIFIFGFSRGAYTARSLAGMIAICGLPTGILTIIWSTLPFRLTGTRINDPRLTPSMRCSMLKLQWLAYGTQSAHWESPRCLERLMPFSTVFWTRVCIQMF